MLSSLLFVFLMCVFFTVTIISVLQPAAASAPFGATLSAQIIPYTIKLQPPPVYKKEIDYKVVEAWI